MASKMVAYPLLTFLLLLHLHYSAAQSIKAGYWTPLPDFPPSNINTDYFTHLFCAFADLDPTTYEVIISSANSEQFSTFTETVQQNKHSIKTLLSIGGGDSSAPSFASMAAEPSTRESFIDSSISLARSNNFHGLDLDWEYPKTTQDMTNFGTLLTEWRSAATAEATRSRKPPLLLSAAVFYSSNYYSIMLPVSEISNSLDWINIMAYDFYTPDSSSSPTKTGPPAALYNPTSQESESGAKGVSAWIQSGMHANKIVLGLPFYGHGWLLVNANDNGIFSPANGKFSPANEPAKDDFGYGEVKSFISDKSATTVYDNTFVTDYCYAGTTWMGYDDKKSISAKVKYAKKKGLLGYFAWHVGADPKAHLAQEASETWGPA